MFLRRNTFSTSPLNQEIHPASRPWVRLGFLVNSLLGILTTLHVLGLSGVALAQESDKNSLDLADPRPYMRVERSKGGTVSLQIAARKFVTSQESGPAVWLVGVSHIGESNYYQTLQKYLNKQDVVLFEGVGYDELQRETDGDDSEIEVSDASSLQSTLAESLGLAFQLDAIDYDRPNFRNSDIPLNELMRLLTRDRGSKSGDSNPTNQEFLTLIQAMDGSSWMGKLLQVGVKILGASPKLQAMSRLMLVELLGQIQGDLSEVQGLPPSIQEMMRVLIQSRNKVVMKDLKQTLDQNPQPSSIAVFYGAAHMNDFEKRLKSDHGFRFSEEKWFSAVTVDPEQGGLSKTELMMIRGLVRWQLNTLQQQFPGAKEN